jgi:flagellar protein FliS
MAQSINVHYRETEILSADPLKLVQMLYRAALDSVAAARRHVRAKEVAERNAAIMRAWSIVNELMHSLDHAAGGDIARNLAGLYAYIQAQLLEANAKQIEPPLEEVETLLSTLLEGWSAAAVQSAAQAARSPQEAQAGDAEEYVPMNRAY